MKQFAVVQHTYSEFLGLIENQLEKRDIGFAYFRPFVGQDLPGSAGQFDALFVLGGQAPPGDHDQNPWHDDELRLIGIFRDARRPMVGLGYGALVLAEYEGALLSPEPFHNAYWTIAHKTPAGEADALAQAVDGRPVLVNGEPQGRAIGRSKKEAEQQAARQLLKELTVVSTADGPSPGADQPRL